MMHDVATLQWPTIALLGTFAWAVLGFAAAPVVATLVARHEIRRPATSPSRHVAPPSPRQTAERARRTAQAHR